MSLIAVVALVWLILGFQSFATDFALVDFYSISLHQNEEVPFDFCL